MSTIPTTSKSSRVPYTVVGGKRVDKALKKPSALSILVLNRGERLYKSTTFTQLEKLGTGEILSVEGPRAGYDIENLARKFPRVRFILLKEEVNPGEKVNIGISEASGRLAFVLWNDASLVSSDLSRVVEKLDQESTACTVPVLQNPKKELLPTVLSPAFYRKLLRIVPAQPTRDGLPTIYPFDYCGIYNRERFTLIGGFDHSLDNPYWQKLDFGFRCFLWGERIQTTTGIQLSYHGEVPAEDTTPDESYKIFFLKNLAISFSRDSGTLPSTKFLTYLLKTGSGVVGAWKDFKEVRRWVEINRYRFKQDARSLTELWEMDQ